eukprot:CAMPEP_0181246180 /NCGR_PEP_ID=MMETSP1096-20121128/43867_1 /TAXON_ID=156174 ORGANISM="Chrysochromulina ericina, Strain CCMP281" /NCGR_SAMPLE_ID=MMETSP1096 /ASSEMBLY_ACC=CAM_ASM_000453 /LENGTH=123 /DNA_ID=CAMNT_0023343001 /DNA_START=334 /DNA_END=705 /DNA_ORIENTATION=+
MLDDTEETELRCLEGGAAAGICRQQHDTSAERLALAPAGGAAAPGGATAPGGAAAVRSGAEGSMSMLGAQRLLLSLESRKSLCVAAITHWPRHAHTQICSCIIFPFVCPALSLLGGFGREASL